MKSPLNRYYFPPNGSNRSFIYFPFLNYFSRRLSVHFKQFHLSENLTTLRNQQLLLFLLVFFVSACQTKKQTP